MASLEGAMLQNICSAREGFKNVLNFLLFFRFPAETVKMTAEGSVALAEKTRALVDKTLKSSAASLKSSASLEIVEKILCKECAIEIYGTVRDVVVHPSDATFRCPALGREGSCKSETVSYRQFFTGSCCEPASRWLTKNEKG